MNILRFYDRFIPKIASGVKHQSFRCGDPAFAQGELIELRGPAAGSMYEDQPILPPVMIWQCIATSITFNPSRSDIISIRVGGAPLSPLQSEAFAILDGFDPAGSPRGAATALQEMSMFLATIYPDRSRLEGHVVRWIPPGGFDQVSRDLVEAITTAKERLDVLE